MVHMKQMGSREDWLKFRTSYIGGSDASCIIGANPWKTNVELWQEKTGKKKPDDISDNPAVRYGSKAEKHLRELFRLDFPQYEVGYIENNIFTSDAFPYAHASLDGWLRDIDGRQGVLEIKTTNILQSIQKEKWQNRIPMNYYAQVLHYLAVTGFDFAIVKAQLRYDYDGEIFLNTKHYKIERDEVEDDINYLMQAEAEFYEYIKNDKEPPLKLPEI